MYLNNMLVVCVIPDLQNPSRSCLTQLFIDFQGFVGVDDFSMLRIKDVHHMIKDHNLVPNQEALLVTIQQRKLQALMWWLKDCQHCGLVMITAAWTATDLTSSVTQINIEYPSEGDIKA